MPASLYFEALPNEATTARPFSGPYEDNEILRPITATDHLTGSMKSLCEIEFK
jgi:hypothetical protein